MVENDLPKDRLSIGQFAQLSLISIKALRLYHRKGLLEPASIDPFTGYRYYLKVQLNDARLIRMMRQMEMPLALIHEMLEVMKVDSKKAESMLFEYQQSFEKRKQLVDAISDQLLDYINHKEFEMTIEVNQVKAKAQHVVSITKNVPINELDQYIGQTIGRLQKFVQDQGEAPVGPPFGIYHGQINDDGDTGPIEVCVPVNQAVTGDGDIEYKIFDEVNTAVVDMRGPDCSFPAILKGYDATSNWIIKNGHEMAGSPREVWFTAPGEAAHMQIQWPFS
ncbi:MAG: MerR family transcriptional regulator [Chloroflexota bacterium]